MVFVKATPQDFDTVGIYITTEMVVNDKAIKHVEHLTAEQMNTIRFDNRFEFVDEIQATVTQ